MTATARRSALFLSAASTLLPNHRPAALPAPFWACSGPSRQRRFLVHALPTWSRPQPTLLLPEAGLPRRPGDVKTGRARAETLKLAFTQGHLASGHRPRADPRHFGARTGHGRLALAAAHGTVSVPRRSLWIWAGRAFVSVRRDLRLPRTHRRNRSAGL